MIIEDYTGTGALRLYIRAVIALAWLGMVIIGIYVVIGSAY
jgi:succinate dehydrogenase hydrophobic anchor subunit